MVKFKKIAAWNVAVAVLLIIVNNISLIGYQVQQLPNTQVPEWWNDGTIWLCYYTVFSIAMIIVPFIYKKLFNLIA